MKIHLIMPMAGGGTRFGKENFELPKPLIKLHGYPFFYWATESVARNIELEGITFVVLQEHIDKYGIDIEIHKFYPHADIVVVPHVLDGAVLTCNEGISNLNGKSAILFNDCDHLFKCSEFEKFCRKEKFDTIDGGLLTFKSQKPCYSYVEYDKSGNVIGTVEKVVVSNDAICGAYYFANKSIFKSAFDEYIDNCNYSEYYVSGLYNIMARNGMNIEIFNTDLHIPFGTPEEYLAAQNINFDGFKENNRKND